MKLNQLISSFQLSSVSVGLLFLSGCALGPDYRRPAINAPENFRFAPDQTTNSLADLAWWQVFQDPALQDLIRTALTNNHDLKRAVARVEQARNLAVVARAPLFPQVGYGGNVGRGKNALFNSPAGLNGATESSASVTLNAAWEIDVWGRIRRLSWAARAEYLATDEARCGVTITLVSEVMSPPPISSFWIWMRNCASSAPRPTPMPAATGFSMTGGSMASPPNSKPTAPTPRWPTPSFRNWS